MEYSGRICENLVESCWLEEFEYQIEPYTACEHQCLYCYMFNRKESNYGRKILFCENSVALLESELSNLEPKCIYIGMETDPYQPCEERMCITKGILEVLLEMGFSASILTKSDLILRDLEIIKKMKEPSAGISIAFHEESTRKLFERNAPSNRRRINAIKKLKDNGIETYTLICPVMPYITDVEFLIEEVNSFSDTIWVYGLSFSSSGDNNWKNIENILKNNYPELLNKYKDILFRGNRSYWIELKERLKTLSEQKGINLIVEL